MAKIKSIINKFLVFLGIAVAVTATASFLISVQQEIPRRIQDKMANKYTDQEKETYYDMFNKNLILDGSEKNAQEVLKKLDVQYAQKRQDFIQLANLSSFDEPTVKALFILNFVAFSNNYGVPDMDNQPKDIKTLIWKINRGNCQTNTMLLQMLLERAGYRTRTIAINGLDHGFNEVYLNGRWNILDATTNLWFNAGYEEIMSGKTPQVYKFFLDDSDIANSEFDINANVSKLRVNMTNLGKTFKPIAHKYNYVDLSGWEY